MSRYFSYISYTFILFLCLSDPDNVLSMMPPSVVSSFKNHIQKACNIEPKSMKDLSFKCYK